MIGLLPDRPQRGKSSIRNLGRLADNFEEEFAKHCRDIDHRRITREKRLQSFLVSDAYQHGRRMNLIERAAAEAGEHVELLFITDEISIRPMAADGTRKTVCDVLALRRLDDGREVPVVMELKSERAVTDLIQQTTTYAGLVVEHQGVFEQLYGALLGRKVSFDAPPEKWIVWPAGGDGRRRDHALFEHGISVIEYEDAGDGYRLLMGHAGSHAE